MVYLGGEMQTQIDLFNNEQTFKGNTDDLNLIIGDALEKLKEIPSESVDLIIADPPYNIGKDYGNSKDNLSHEHYLEFSRNWLTEAKRVLKKDGTIYIYMGMKFISYVYQILEQELGLEFNSWITWYYTQGIGKTKGFSPRHDDILMFTKSTKYKFYLDDIKIPQKYYRQRNNMRGANPGNVWEFSHVHYSEKNRQEHPTQKPEGLMERMILASTREGDVVLDPFLGSGTTMRVAQILKRKCIGIEMNEEYADMINSRLNAPFYGFDSMDMRSKRIPLDLRKEDIRIDYLVNHIDWFFKNHESEISTFKDEIIKMYGKDTLEKVFKEYKIKKALSS